MQKKEFFGIAQHSCNHLRIC